MASLFLSLYSRSRYAPDRVEKLLEDLKRKRSEVERFVVACFALCLQQDEELREAFMEKILKAKEVKLQEWSVAVEPHAWCDLLVQRKGEIHVIECKMDAALKPKQNPSKNAFQGKNGYGRKIDRHFSNVSRRTYWTLGAKPWPQTSKPLVPIGRQLQWATLKPILEDSPIGCEFAALLADLERRGFEDHKPEVFISEQLRTQLRTKPERIVDMLRRTLDPVGLEARDTPVEDASKSEKWWYFGLDYGVSDRGRANKAVRREVGVRKGEAAGWIGYYGELNQLWREVWLYCGTKNARDACVKKLGDEVERDVENGTFYLRVRSAAEEVKKDEPWFAEVIATVFGTKKSTPRT